MQDRGWQGCGEAAWWRWTNPVESVTLRCARSHAVLVGRAFHTDADASDRAGRWLADAQRATSASSRALHSGVPLAAEDEGAVYRKLLGSHALPKWDDDESEEDGDEDESSSDEEYDYSTLSHIAREKRKDYTHPELDEELLESGLDIEGFEMRVMNLNRTCKSTKAGGLTRYSALVMCGNRKGLVGYALSKVCAPSHSAVLSSSSLTLA